MSKRKLDEVLSEDWKEPNPKVEPAIKNSLDSDEEDDEANEDNYNVMHEDEFEGTEDGPVAAETDVGFTAFNMKEELEEGHFDKDGHYLWKKEKQIRDNWLDNIDWVQVRITWSEILSMAESCSINLQIKPGGPETTSQKTGDDIKGLADSDSEDDDQDTAFDSTLLYKKILEFLRPGETVSKALCRLGQGKKRMTTAERWKKKKEKQAGVETNENADKIIQLTEFANELLTRTGNMDIYQESYEQIKKKIELSGKQSHPSKQEAELDMYSDDFDVQEKAKIDDHTSTDMVGTEKPKEGETTETNTGIENDEVTWELKWSQNETAEVHGPHTTEQMQAWAKEGYFKSGAWVRRTGQQGQFYSAARVDFELYL
ncbi:CD2 antigen cytoplasmic tail-binding protein 2 homolog isoform X2 [Athalia rosae]|uniref:CD2 antigen cytoplasmic tail-binding protein 2 homolog isoform X2 n=1 Tax=Athalia rosae TaxID=37344 RepID=UPI0020331E4B|nr:CD2 antigen cytoplasmic tail-binding protein 2 homolog isoform X2 [Athalia rosae]